MVVDLQILYRFWCRVSFIQNIILKGVSFMSAKSPHAALICCYYFCILLVQGRRNNTKTTLCSAKLSSCFTTF